MNPNFLLDLDDEEFRRLVDLDVRGKAAADLHTGLIDPLIAARRVKALRYWKLHVEGQLAARHADHMANELDLEARLQRAMNDQEKLELATTILASRVAFHQWRGAALRFRTAVELHTLSATSTTTTLEGRWARLRTGVVKHRDSIHPDEVTEADTDLWALLDDEVTGA